VGKKHRFDLDPDSVAFAECCAPRPHRCRKRTFSFQQRPQCRSAAPGMGNGDPAPHKPTCRPSPSCAIGFWLGRAACHHALREVHHDFAALGVNRNRSYQDHQNRQWLQFLNPDRLVFELILSTLGLDSLRVQFGPDPQGLRGLVSARKIRHCLCQ
jgi:hypothetical protein